MSEEEGLTPLWGVTPYGPRERVVAFNLEVTDAALDVFCSIGVTGIKHRWKRVTSGSTIHILTPNQPVFSGELRLRAIGNNRTHIMIGESSSIQWTAYLAWLIGRFVDWLREDQHDMEELAKQQPPHSDNAPPELLLDIPGNGPGRHTPREDDWAWDEINIRKRPREAVRAEWLDKMSEKRRSGLKDIKRSFRHAIDPERRRKK